MIGVKKVDVSKGSVSRGSGLGLRVGGCRYNYWVRKRVKGEDCG
jgi:hypothetical protein